MVTSTHVPAWKRLGLKLKNAADTPQIAELPKRKREPELESLNAHDTQFKKSKIEKSITKSLIVKGDKFISATEEKNPKKPIPIIKASSPLRDVPTTNPALSTPHLTRQKSVSFTPETKIEDGDGLKQLFSTWVAEQKSQDPNFNASTAQQPAFKIPEPPQVLEIVDSTLPDKEKRMKRTEKTAKSPKEKTQKLEKKQKKIKKQVDIVKPNLAPALKYLDQFCNSKDTWKFNKIHQINLLKNVYSADSIPSASIEQFYKYMDGLQGQARNVLRDSAIQARIEDIEKGTAGFEKLNDAEKKQVEYDDALNKYVTTMIANDAHPNVGYEEWILSGLSDIAMRPRMINRMRAERIMLALKDAETDKEEFRKEEPKRREDGKLVRKRKSRTTIEISDSSSDDSSSDSDSESDIELSAQKTEARVSTGEPPIGKDASLPTSSNSDTSSSGDSTSSNSDSDSN